MYSISIKQNNGIVDDSFSFIVLEYQTFSDSKIKTTWCTNNVNKKGITTCSIEGFKIKIDVINNKILDIKDVSTIRNGTAKILQSIN